MSTPPSPSRQPSRTYWSERQGRGPQSVPLVLPKFKRLCFSVLGELDAKFYFQQAFGYYCVDEGDVPGTVGGDADAWFLRTLGRESVWPYTKRGDEYDADTLFDVLEVLYDLVSYPVQGRYHDYSACGWHYSTFDRAAGQQEYRALLNPILRRYEQPLVMDGTGQIIQAVPDEFRQLLAAAPPPTADDDLVTSRIAEAVRMFRGRNATTSDRRQAVRELADVLEPIRGDVKENMLNKDESAIYALANGFAIRHNNREQARHYDDTIWLQWAFYVYLATIHAVLRVAARQQGN
jgi:hypothetical protein